MTVRPLRILHAIHDFLPRHQAGSEIYAAALCRALADRHHVTVLCAEYDLARPHGSVAWRLHDGLAVAEVVNNWNFDAFAETYRPRSLARALHHVLRATVPDVVHVHSLLNLSFELPALARTRGAAVAATLHDFTMVCPSGGQRVHRAEAHVCHDIEPDRCARCFAGSPWAAQMAAARVDRIAGRGIVEATASFLRSRAPKVMARVAAGVAAHGPAAAMRAADVTARLDAAREVLAAVDLAVSPSAALARDLARFGLPPERTVVADYGFPRLEALGRPRAPGPLRIGFIGTLVWHKGVHVLLEAVRGLPRSAYEVRIAGDPALAPEYAAQLRGLAADLPVRFTGRFSRDETAAIYGGLDVLVVPSLWPENSPLVIHEAFMAGVAVVGAQSGGIPELVRDGVSGLLFDPTRPKTLTAALRRLLETDGLAVALAAAAPPVRTIEQDAAEWDARYRELAAARSRRTA